MNIYLDEFLNSFEEIHYFLAGISTGLIVGVIITFKSIKSIHKFIYRNKYK